MGSCRCICTGLVKGLPQKNMVILTRSFLRGSSKLVMAPQPEIVGNRSPVPVIENHCIRPLCTCCWLLGGCCGFMTIIFFVIHHSLNHSKTINSLKLSNILTQSSTIIQLSIIINPHDQAQIIRVHHQPFN